jgi:hypothetical protein
MGKMKLKFPKFDLALIAEISGVALVTYGLSAFSFPLACIVLGAFLIWITEKAE